MADNLLNTGTLEYSRINIHESWEVSWWCSKFECINDQLTEAVSTVGASAAAVREYLQAMK